MIPKEDVIVVVTKEGYVKRVSKKSYAASDGEDTTIKEDDYLIGLFEQNTLDTLLLFTNKGNYLFVPVHELPDLKWKDLGKHISNIIAIMPEEKIIKAIPVKEFDDNRLIMITTKDGMIKQTSLSEFKVQRYSKEMTYIKLKENDEVVSVIMNNNKEVFLVTKNGYGLWYGSSEVPVIGLKTAGVKAINLKDDEVVSANKFNVDDEYLTVITSKGLAKRVKLSEFEKTSRAKRGLLVLKEVKSNPQQVTKAMIVNPKTMITIKTSLEDAQIKLTEVPIMDRYSTGSSIIKAHVMDVFEKVNISKDEIKDEEISEVPKAETINKKEVSLKEIDDKFMTIDDFLDNFD